MIRSTPSPFSNAHRPPGPSRAIRTASSGRPSNPLNTTVATMRACGNGWITTSVARVSTSVVISASTSSVEVSPDARVPSSTNSTDQRSRSRSRRTNSSPAVISIDFTSAGRTPEPVGSTRVATEGSSPRSVASSSRTTIGIPSTIANRSRLTSPAGPPISSRSVVPSSRLTSISATGGSSPKRARSKSPSRMNPSCSTRPRIPTSPSTVVASPREATGAFSDHRRPSRSSSMPASPLRTAMPSISRSLEKSLRLRQFRGSSSSTRACRSSPTTSTSSSSPTRIQLRPATVRAPSWTRRSPSGPRNRTTASGGSRPIPARSGPFRPSSPASGVRRLAARSAAAIRTFRIGNPSATISKGEV